MEQDVSPNQDHDHEPAGRISQITSPAIFPLKALREHTTALEAAISLITQEPAQESVHRLRTTTRRIEAQLSLLSMLGEDVPQMAEKQKRRRQVGRLLSQVRRSAGKVRDLDVQLDMLEEVANGAAAEIAGQARDLRHSLRHVRATEAARLQKEIAQHGGKLVRGMEGLLKALEPSAQVSILPARLEEVTRAWYRGRATDLTSDAEARASRHASSGQLHDWRKAAKLARYIAEAARFPQGWAEQGIEARAASYESLQKSGGTWHDLLTLTKIARRALGRSSELARYLKKQRKQALRIYQQHLSEFQSSEA